MAARVAVVLAVAAAAVVAAAPARPRGRYEVHADGYDLYCVGACDEDATPQATPGYMLMGGSTDVNAGFRWFNGNTNGGDVVVIRASGSDGYNDYIYDLGGVASVTTLVTNQARGAEADEVEERILRAEGIFMAGGDQWDYVSMWNNTRLSRAVQHCITNKTVTLGGTSAGLAVMGEFIYSAETGSVISEEALGNPYHRFVTLTGPLFDVPFMETIITDSHFFQRDRMGRLMAFLARLKEDGMTTKARAIAVSEVSAVLIDASGQGSLVGAGPVYFMETSNGAQVCEPGTPLTIRDVSVYKLATTDGLDGTFDVVAWAGQGGRAYTLSAVNGVLTSTQENGLIY